MLINLKRKITYLLFAGVIVCNMCVVFAKNEPGKAKEDLNIREAPNKDSQMIGCMKKNSKLQIVDHSNGYAKILTETGNYGWVVESFVQVGEENKVQETKAKEKGAFTGKLLNNIINKDLTDVLVDDVYKNKSSQTTNNSYRSLDGFFNYMYGKINSGSVLSRGETNSPEQTEAPKVEDVKKQEEKQVEKEPEKQPEREAYCKGSVLFVREGSSISFSATDKIYKGDKFKVKGKSGDWFEIVLSNGKTGWVNGEYVSYEFVKPDTAPTEIEAKKEEEKKKAEEKKAKESIGNKIVNLALKYEGCYYVYGGEAPPYFDCSGYVKYVLNKLGFDMNRVAADQARQGTYIPKSQLQPGDIVFFDTNGGANYINHVGIYIGNGQMIHASSPSSKYVKKDTIMSGYYSRYYMTARRMN